MVYPEVVVIKYTRKEIHNDLRKRLYHTRRDIGTNM